MSTQPKKFLTPEEYLAIERQAEFKSEYIGGEMFAMAATRPHNSIASNLDRDLNSQLRNRPCLTFGSDMKVRISAGGLYTYPDAAVVCSTPLFADQEEDVLLNPTLLAEVLSPSTESYDRGFKWEHYRAVPSLRHYLMIAQDRIHVELYTRQEDGSWRFEERNSPEDSLELAAVNCRLLLSDLYEKVELPAEPRRHP